MEAIKLLSKKPASTKTPEPIINPVEVKEQQSNAAVSPASSASQISPPPSSPTSAASLAKLEKKEDSSKTLPLKGLDVTKALTKLDNEINAPEAAKQAAAPALVKSEKKGSETPKKSAAKPVAVASPEMESMIHNIIAKNKSTAGSTSKTSSKQIESQLQNEKVKPVVYDT